MVIHALDNNSTDIRDDIRSLEDSVSSRSGTVSDWNTEVVAIRERIRGIWGYAREKELISELERVVDMIREREQQGIQDGDHNTKFEFQVCFVVTKFEI